VIVYVKIRGVSGPCQNLQGAHGEGRESLFIGEPVVESVENYKETR